MAFRARTQVGRMERLWAAVFPGEGLAQTTAPSAPTPGLPLSSPSLRPTTPSWPRLGPLGPRLGLTLQKRKAQYLAFVLNAFN
jgi:hypothetical protein